MWPYCFALIISGNKLDVKFYYDLRFLHRDAVMLARLRLSPMDPVLHELVASWAASLARDGNFESAAKWYV
jgi:hypothetical protein